MVLANAVAFWYTTISSIPLTIHEITNSVVLFNQCFHPQSPVFLTLGYSLTGLNKHTALSELILEHKKNRLRYVIKKSSVFGIVGCLYIQ